MLHTLLFGGALAAVTMVLHAAGLTTVLVIGARWLARPPTRFWPTTWLLIRLTWMLLLIHLVEILVWGTFYWLRECLPDARSAFYFSGVTYTTLGYGDVLLSDPWRLLAPIESLTGILMCGLSTGVFFALVSRLFNPGIQTRTSIKP